MDDIKWARAHTVFTGVVALFTLALVVVACWQYQLYSLDQRPWVGPTNRTVIFDRATGKFLGFQWHYMNGGKSPARNLRFNLSLKTGTPLKEEVSAIEAPVIERCNNSQSLPGTEGFTALPGAVQIYLLDGPQEVLDSGESIIANRLGLYFVGCVDYEDTSGRNHRTHVCEFYVPGSHIFMACARGNDAS